MPIAEGSDIVSFGNEILGISSRYVEYLKDDVTELIAIRQLGEEDPSPTQCNIIIGAMVQCWIRAEIRKGSQDWVDRFLRGQAPYSGRHVRGSVMVGQVRDRVQDELLDLGMADEVRMTGRTATSILDDWAGCLEMLILVVEPWASSDRPVRERRVAKWVSNALSRDMKTHDDVRKQVL